MVGVFSSVGGFDDAQAHIEQAKPHATNDTYLLARALMLQVDVWTQRSIFLDARPEASYGVDVFREARSYGRSGALDRFSSKLTQAIWSLETVGRAASRVNKLTLRILVG